MWTASFVSGTGIEILAARPMAHAHENRSPSCIFYIFSYKKHEENENQAWQRAEQSFYCTHTFDETNSDSQREGRSPSVNDIYANITI